MKNNRREMQDGRARTANQREIAHRRQKKKRKKRRRQIFIRMILAVAVIILVVYTGVHLVQRIRSGNSGTTLGSAVSAKVVGEAPDYDVQLLTINEYSRPGTAIDTITGIVVHYTANPGTTAQQNRDYFEGLKDSHLTSASSHFVIGIDGELIQCIPCNEIAYASNDRNHDTIAIECCIPDDTGKFTDETYDTLVHLVAWLCGRYELSTEDVIRHYDVTGKMCPKYFVEHEDAWTQFRTDVFDYIEENGED